MLPAKLFTINFFSLNFISVKGSACFSNHFCLHFMTIVALNILLTLKRIGGVMVSVRVLSDVDRALVRSLIGSNHGL